MAGPTPSLRHNGMLWLRPGRLLPWLVLAVSFGVSHHLWRIEQQQARQVLQTDFDFFVREAIERIDERMLDYQEVLRGTQGLFAGHGFVSRDAFRAYVRTLRLQQDFAGIQGMSFAKLVAGGKIAAHVAEVREQGYSDYAVKPPGRRDAYAPVIYIEPFAGRNLRAFGHDPYADPIRRAAMERARDADNTAITDKLTLVQEDGRHAQSGFMMYLPVYRNGAPTETVAERRANIEGWVAAAFRMDDLMLGMYGEHANALDIEIYDGNEMSPRSFMNDSDGKPGSRLLHAQYQEIRHIQIAGHPWTVILRSQATFEARLNREKPQFVAGAGILTSLMLTLLTWLLANGRERALKTAGRMDRALIKSEARLSEITSTMGEGVYVLDEQGRITFTNPELQRVLGWTENELLGQNAHVLFHFDSRLPRSTHLCEIEMAVRFGQSYRSDNKSFYRKDGTVLPVAVSASPIMNSGQVIGSVVVFHDITERKNTEMALAAVSYKNEMLLRMASDGIHMLDEDGNVLQVNEAFCRMLGYTPEEMQGMNVAQWDAQWSSCELKQKIHEFLDARKNLMFETRHRCKNGQKIDVEISATAVEIAGQRMLYASARDVSERKRVEEALRTTEERWSFALEGAGDGVWDWNVQTGEAVYSVRLRAILGYAENELFNTYTEWDRRMHPEDKPGVMSELQAYLAGARDTYAPEYRILCKDGSWKWVLARGKIMRRDAEGRPLRMLGTLSDISQRREREEALQLAATVFETVDEAVTVTDLENRIVAINPAFTRITGYTLAEVQGRNPRLLASGTHPPQFYSEMWGALLGIGSWSGEICNRRKSGEPYIEWLSIKMVRDQHGRHTHYIGVFSDISARKAAEERIHHLAHYDVLTDLPNRMLMTDRIHHALVQARRDKMKMALMFIDLDKFKPVNDRLGHNIGDLLLQEVAARLLDSVRESDTVARIGGDEFVVLLSHVESEQDALVVAGKVLATLNDQFEIAGHKLFISSSIGIALYPLHGKDERTLVKNADIAMYRAKEQGRNNAQVFHPEMLEKRKV